ncbi:MAG: PAS domain S-box protein [Candidatus Kapaibacteriota bacterium]
MKIFKSKVFSGFVFLVVLFSISVLLFGVVVFLGIRYISAQTKEKILAIEQDYLKKTIESQKKYELFSKNANDLIFICDKDNKIVEVNPKVSETLGYSSDELISKSFIDLIVPEDTEQFSSCVNQKKYNFQIRLLGKTSAHIDCFVSVNEINVEGNSLFFYVVQNISELIKNVRKIETLNLFLASISAVNHIILKRYELGEIFSRSCDIFVNHKLFLSAVFLRYSSEEDLYFVVSHYGMDFSNVLGAKIPAKEFYIKYPFVKNAILGKTIYYINDLQSYEHKTPEILQLLEYKVNSVVIIPILHNDVLFGLFILSSKHRNLVDFESLTILEEMQSDISFAVKGYFKNIRLTESEFKKKLFFDRSSNGFLLLDVNGRVDDANTGFTEVVGLSRNELLNMTIYDLFPQNKKELSQVLSLLLDGGIEKLEIPFDKNGEKLWYLMIGEFIKELDLYLLTFTDITEEKRYQDELEKQKQKAIELEQLKTNILENISHEFRTPLNGILGFSKYLKSTIEDNEIKEFCDLIYKSAFRLYRSLESLIFSSEIVSGIVNPRKEVIDLKMFLSDYFEELKSSLEKENVQLNLEFDCDECLALTDKEIIKAIIYSLVNNAMKFTKEGNVTIKVKKICEDVQGCLLIEISDTGIGIQPEMKDKIFELFRQGSEGLSRNFEGLGVGLYNAKMLVELLGGSLDFETEVGKGTTFKIRI